MGGKHEKAEEGRKHAKMAEDKVGGMMSFVVAISWNVREEFGSLAYDDRPVLPVANSESIEYKYLSVHVPWVTS